MQQRTCWEFRVYTEKRIILHIQNKHSKIRKHDFHQEKYAYYLPTEMQFLINLGQQQEKISFN